MIQVHLFLPYDIDMIHKFTTYKYLQNESVQYQIHLYSYFHFHWKMRFTRGAIQLLHNAVGRWGGGGVCEIFPVKKHYECIKFNVVSIMRGWVGVKFPGKKPYVTLEWPQNE